MDAPPDYWVLVPFYDNLDFLRQTLQSVVAQTDPKWRAIVVDDSPIDRGVHAVIEALDDERIAVVRNETNLGVAGSFNRCFELAVERGAELAMILHADDLLEPGYVAVVRAAHAAAPDATCVAPKVTVVGADGQRRRSVPDTVKRWLWPRNLDRLAGERGLQLLLRGQFFYCPAVSYRLSLLSLPAWNQRWTQVMDLELYGRTLLSGGSIVLEPAPVFRYRRHDQSMTQLNSATMMRTVEETEVCRMLAGEAERLGWRRAAREGRLRVTVRLQALMRLAQFVMRGRIGAASGAFWLTISR
jgi:glycosyltransferase involved in cell wall biosynthesis